MEITCQFCREKIGGVVGDNIHECPGCGTEYWKKNAVELEREVREAEERGYEVRVLYDYAPLEDGGVHLVFVRLKDYCYGAD